MTGKPQASKSEDERVKETEKSEAETERSLAVAKEKLAHGIIESIEKRRKSSLIYSLLQRIDLQTRVITETLRGITPSKRDLPITTSERELVQEILRTHESIRYDLKEIMEMNDEKLKKLFPEIGTYFETREQAEAILLKLINQVGQMGMYCLRMT